MPLALIVAGNVVELASNKFPPEGASYQLHVLPPVAGVPEIFATPKPQTDPFVPVGAESGVVVTAADIRELAQPFAVCSAK